MITFQGFSLIFRNGILVLYLWSSVNITFVHDNHITYFLMLSNPLEIYRHLKNDVSTA